MATVPTVGFGRKILGLTQKLEKPSPLAHRPFWEMGIRKIFYSSSPALGEGDEGSLGLA